MPKKLNKNKINDAIIALDSLVVQWSTWTKKRKNLEATALVEMNRKSQEYDRLMDLLSTKPFKYEKIK